MAKLNFADGSVWDNTVTGSDKYTTKVPGGGAKSNRPLVTIHGDFRALETQKRHLMFVTGTFDFDSSYPTGGESVAELFSSFPRGLTGCLVAQPDVAAVRTVEVDTVNQKFIGYSDGFTTEVGNGTNLSTVTGLRFIAWGY